MHQASPSPFLEIPESEWFCASPLCFAIFDSFPVSPGHVLVITRRLVPTFFDCTQPEQAALMELVGEVKRLLDQQLDPKPDGYNVGFNAGSAAGQTVPHVHVHVIPRYAGDMADPRGGVRHVIPEKGNYLARPWQQVGNQSEAPRIWQVENLLPREEPRFSLTTGPDRPLWPRLADRLPGASEIDLLASFVQRSGLEVIREALFAALAAGARVRLLVGDYLGITAPDALRHLLVWMDLFALFEARLAELHNLTDRPSSFHPKAWRIADSSGGIVVVGSSNLSKAALETGVEWNVIGETSGGHAIDNELAAAFDDLWQQATLLSADVVERYAVRAAEAAELRRVWDGESPQAAAPAPPPVALTPRPWQAAALDSLSAIRDQGYAKALVAVATGLGKTWLAAFDVVAFGKLLGRPPRVLVVAHRAELLAQAEATLRQAMEREWGPVAVEWWVGSGGACIRPVENSSPHGAQLVIASIQKISRPDSLAAIDAAPPFDYCVVDEVHHAEAPSYRRVLARLKSSFTLGLTATPERTDGVDVATLFDDILAYQATIGDGIAEGSLVPFRYRGLKDDVDFEQIPWRNGRFDVGVLEAALESAPRMERLWAEWQTVSAGRTLVFCCSRRHALFVRDWLMKRRVAAAAVFSDGSPGGPVSDPRMASLAAFRDGSLSALCVVDLFNEGIDIPLVDRVVMLRPTESKIVFLQQLGRGLRAAAGKTRLEVIDFVGNHRVFASRLVHLLSLVPHADGAADANNFTALKAYLAGGEPQLPDGCVLDVEVEAKRLLEQFLPKGKAAVVEAYRGMRAELGRRPTPSELFHAGYLPLTVSAEYGSWFDFCRSEGDLSADEQAAATSFLAWLKMLQTTNLTKSYKMVVLRVLLDHDALWDGIEIPQLAAACRVFLENHPALRADLEGAAFTRVPSDPVAEARAFAEWWLEWPLTRWMDDQSGRRWFTRHGDRFVADFKCPPELREAIESLTGELVDYRLAHYTQSRLASPKAPRGSEAAPPSATFLAKVSHSTGNPILFLPTVEAVPFRPTGPTRVRLPDGSEWVFRFVKVACNVAHPADSDDKQNQIHTLIREWFGPDAGLPGTGFEVEFTSVDGAWHVSPHGSPQRKPLEAGAEPPPALSRSPTPAPPPPLLDSPTPASRYVTHVPVYDLTAAAGFWGPESLPEEIGWTEVPGVSLKPGMFVTRVTGKSMEPLIPDGSWCLFRPCPAGSREGRIVLVQLGTVGVGENGGRFTVKKYHSEKTVTAAGWQHERIQLLPVNRDFEQIEIEPPNSEDLRIVGEYLKTCGTNEQD